MLSHQILHLGKDPNDTLSMPINGQLLPSRDQMRTAASGRWLFRIRSPRHVRPVVRSRLDRVKTSIVLDRRSCRHPLFRASTNATVCFSVVCCDVGICNADHVVTLAFAAFFRGVGFGFTGWSSSICILLSNHLACRGIRCSGLIVSSRTTVASVRSTPQHTRDATD